MRRSSVLPTPSFFFSLIFAVGFLDPALAAAATPLPTTTELTLSPGNSVAVGAPVTLKASVSSSGLPVSPGVVVFCNADSAYCEDLNILGQAQLTASGTASVNLILPIGSHQIRAEFRGTVSNAPSSSSTQSLIVSGKYPTVTTFQFVPRPGSFDLSAKVTSIGVPAQTGTLNFPDQANHLMPLRSSLVGSPTLTFAPLAGGPVSGPLTSGAVADLNGDGKLDQLVYDSANNSVTVLLGNGGGSFTTGATMPVGPAPDAIAVGDFNNDDILDFAVTNGGDSTAYIFLGNGDGSFSAPKAISVGSKPNSISVGDFNRDGNADLAVSSSLGTGIWLGNGKGGFTIVSRPVLPQATTPLHVADINGDGIADLVYTNSGFFSVVYLGVGDGTFVEAPKIPASCGGDCVDTVVADFNGDGKLDLAIAASGQNSHGAVLLVLGNADGTFGSPIYIPSNLHPTFLSVGDFNGDGKLDLCVAEAYPNDPSYVFTDIFLGNGDGTFGLFQTATSNLSATGDFNGDGMTDFALGTPTGVALAGWQTTVAANGVPLTGSLGIHNVFANYEGDATHAASLSGVLALQGPKAVTTTALVASPTTIALGQAIRLVATVSPSVVGGDKATGTVTFSNGPNTLGVVAVSDGRAELSTNALPVGSNISLTAYYSGSTEFNSSVSLPVRLNTRGTLRPISTTALSVSPSPSVLQGTVVTLSASVFDAGSPVHTGLVVFYGSTSANPRKIVLGQAQLTPSGVATMRYRPPIGSLGFKAVYQGTNSLAASESAPQSLTVTGQIATSTAISVVPSTYRADVTSYGLLAASGQISFTDATDSNAVFATAPLISLITLDTQLSLTPAPRQNLRALAIKVADFNGDGILDQAAVTGPGELLIMLGNPDGSFTQKFSAGVSGSITVADFNCDGAQDLAVLQTDGYDNTATVEIFLGRGDGTFIRQSTLAVGDAISLVTGDFNGDGIPDLLTTSGYGVPGAAVVLLGNGDGTFRTGLSTGIAEIAVSASSVADFNGDGIPDVIVGFRLLLGNGDGTFVVRNLSSLAANAGCSDTTTMVEADFNGDGIPDILLSNCNNSLEMFSTSNNNTLEVLLGNGNATFTPFQLLVPQYVHQGLIFSAVTGDLNGDGIPDLVNIVGNYAYPPTSLEVSILLGKGGGTFVAGPVVQFPSSTYSYDFPTGLASGDFNGDGTADVLASSAGATIGSEWFSTVTQTSQATATNVTLPGNGPQQVFAAYPGDATHLGSVSATVPVGGAALTHQEH